MTTQLIQSGGIQQIMDFPQSLQQIVYLDFDGELTSYHGEILTVDEVVVEDSSLSPERIAQITAALNEQFAGQNVLFVSELSDQSDYSTIYIGKTSAFAPYGNFAGLAETVDSGNKNKKDKAFVMLDSTNDNAQIIATIAHEAGHLLGTLDHGGEGLQKYAACYDVSSGVTSTGMVLSTYDSMYVMSGGVANSTTINGSFAKGGYLTVYEGGEANSTTVNSSGWMYVSSGGVANSTTVNYGGYLNVTSGGTANNTTVNIGGNLQVASGGVATDVDWTPCIARVDAEDGAIITYISTYSGIYYGSNNTLLSSAMIMSDKNVENASMYVMSGGVANSTTVNYDGRLYVSSGGVANSTTVNAYGVLYVSSGGIANSTTVNSSGWMYVGISL